MPPSPRAASVPWRPHHAAACRTQHTEGRTAARPALEPKPRPELRPSPSQVRGQHGPLGLYQGGASWLVAAGPRAAVRFGSFEALSDSTAGQASRDTSPRYLPDISPISTLYLPYTSPHLAAQAIRARHGRAASDLAAGLLSGALEAALVHPISTLYLPCTSPYLPCISPVPPHISPVPPLYLPISPLHLPCSAAPRPRWCTRPARARTLTLTRTRCRSRSRTRARTLTLTRALTLARCRRLTRRCR